MDAQRENASDERYKATSAQDLTEGLDEMASAGATDEPDSAGPETFDSDWQLDSVLLMAHQLCKTLTPAGPPQTATERLLCSLVERFIRAADLYYVTGVDELLRSAGGAGSFTRITGGVYGPKQPFRAERREILAAISAEWARLLTVVSTARLVDSDDRPMKVLRAVLNAARADLKLRAAEDGGPDFIALPQFGRRFELVSFAYAPEIFLVGVPFGEFFNCWRLGLIWHEMAGIYIRQRGAEPNSVVEVVLVALRALVRDPDVWLAWERRFPGELANLPRGADGYLTDRVLRNWAEELLEDAAGVLCLGSAMVLSLRGALDTAYAPAAAQAVEPLTPRRSRLVAIEVRHPPVGMRLAFAEQLIARREGAEAETLAGMARLAELVWANAREIVNEPLQSDEEGAISRMLPYLRAREAEFDLERALQMSLDAAAAGSVSSRGVRRLVAAATRAFHEGHSSGEQIRTLIFGKDTSVAPSSGIVSSPEDPLFKELRKGGFSQTDELFTYNVSCDGNQASFSIGGWCGYSGHGVMQGSGTAWHT